MSYYYSTELDISFTKAPESKLKMNDDKHIC